MSKETALQQVLIVLANTCKTSALQIASLECEVGALRDTVRGLDPTFPEIFENHKKENENLVSRAIPDVNLLFDEIVRAVKAGEVC
jgi:hypothetical protein